MSESEDDPMFSCDLCEKEYKTKNGLKMHKIRSHRRYDEVYIPPSEAVETNKTLYPRKKVTVKRSKAATRTSSEVPVMEPQIDNVPSTPASSVRSSGKEEEGDIIDLTNQSTQTMESPRKKQMTTKETDEPRLARWRPSASSATRDRISRATNQRMYLISRSDVSELEKKFIVLGSAGNVYTVRICHQPSCTCPDFQKGNLCKHILFVFLKVLSVRSDSQLIYQAALVTSEIKSIFESAPKDPTQVMASNLVQTKYKEITGEAVPTTDTDIGSIKRRAVDGECPICYEAMSANENLVWCELGCGNNIHQDCFNQWKTTKHTAKDVTCVYCRTPWKIASTTTTTVHSESGEYANLAEFQPGMSTEREYTPNYSYYYGRRRRWY